METKAVANESALIVVSGAGNTYLRKTSLAVRAYLYGDEENGPRMPICMSSPGNDFNLEIFCSGGLGLGVVLVSFWGI